MEPYQYFIRVLDELYSSATDQEIETPSMISGGEFSDFSYQIDAIRQGLDCLEKYSGVLIADVVGLGKSVIATTIAHNIKMPRTVVISPPHLKPQWEKYVKKFGLSNAYVVSGGKLNEVYNDARTAKATLYVIDEAHRYRNENTTAYRMLHQIVRSHPENKILLLTATPYNNHPKDIYALIKLFQIPSRATLKTVDNLGLRFGQLIAEYNQLEKSGKRNRTISTEEAMNNLAERMRAIIEPVIIRRSRIDLTEVTKYAEDLGEQEISFARIDDPKTIEYNLGALTERYYKVLEGLSTGEFIGAKYKPLTYLKDEGEFEIKYGEVFSFNRTQQLNMAKLAQRLFVLRFESSRHAFLKTLENMIIAHKTVVKLWQDEKVVAISKSRTLDKLDGIEDDRLTIPREAINSDFIEDVITDLTWLERVYQEWFGKKDNKNDQNYDPKYKRVETTLRELLRENPKRKIVVFTSFADTAEYVVEKLRQNGLGRTLLYTSTGNHALKRIVAQNFDAALIGRERADDYDIIVATDALSEGFNLHRAGVVINYDIPYNPTRVAQRIGRINRIDQQVFDKLIIYNIFPTAIGEKVVNLKGISSLKVLLMNQVIGNDTKMLTEEEEVESFFRQHYKLDTDETTAWDNHFRNIHDEAQKDNELMNKVRKIMAGTAITREKRGIGIESLAVVRRGHNLDFMSMDEGGVIKTMPPQKALEILQADKTEDKLKNNGTKNLAKFRKMLAEPYELPKMWGNRGYALDIIEMLQESCPGENEYLAKLYNALRKYDDLCEKELSIITRLTLDDLQKTISELQQKIPEWYLDAIQTKVSLIETARTQVVLVEDFR